MKVCHYCIGHRTLLISWRMESHVQTKLFMSSKAIQMGGLLPGRHMLHVYKLPIPASVKPVSKIKMKIRVIWTYRAYNTLDISYTTASISCLWYLTNCLLTRLVWSSKLSLNREIFVLRCGSFFVFGVVLLLWKLRCTSMFYCYVQA